MPGSAYQSTFSFHVNENEVCCYASVAANSLGRVGPGRSGWAVSMVAAVALTMKWILVVASLLASPAWADGTPVEIVDIDTTGIMIRYNTITDNTFYTSDNWISIGPQQGNCISLNGNITPGKCKVELPTLEQLDRERDKVWDDWLRVRGYRK